MLKVMFLKTIHYQRLLKQQMRQISDKSKTIRYPTSIFSMLKTTLRVKENIDIGHFNKLLAFLKQLSIGYKAKKSKIFTRNEVRTFLLEAPDNTFNEKSCFDSWYCRSLFYETNGE